MSLLPQAVDGAASFLPLPLAESSAGHALEQIHKPWCGVEKFVKLWLVWWYGSDETMKKIIMMYSYVEEATERHK